MRKMEIGGGKRGPEGLQRVSEAAGRAQREGAERAAGRPAAARAMRAARAGGLANRRVGRRPAGGSHGG